MVSTYDRWRIEFDSVHDRMRELWEEARRLRDEPPTWERRMAVLAVAREAGDLAERSSRLIRERPEPLLEMLPAGWRSWLRSRS